MAQLIVRGIEAIVKTRLRKRALKHGRSMEEEVREILRSAVRGDEKPAAPLGTRMTRRFRGRGLERPIAALRQPVRPAELD